MVAVLIVVMLTIITISTARARPLPVELEILLSAFATWEGGFRHMAEAKRTFHALEMPAGLARGSWEFGGEGS